MSFQVVVTDFLFQNLEPFTKLLRDAGADVATYQCASEEALLALSADEILRVMNGKAPLNCVNP